MRITSLNLKDFRIYEDAEIVFDQPLSIIRGANHAGKSSLAQAIQLALTKQTDGTDPRGAGANDKIRVGGHKAIIDLVIDGKQGPVLLKTMYGPNRQGRDQRITGNAEGISTAFEKYLDQNSERLSCVLDPEYFVRLKPEAQKAVLAALVLPTSYQFDPAMVDLATKHLGKFVWDKSPAALIDQVYDAAYDARKAAKSVLGAIHIPQTPQKPEYDRATVEKSLEQLRKDAAKETKKLKGGGSAEVGRLEAELAQKQKERAQASEDKVTAWDRIADLDGQLLEGPAMTAAKSTASKRKLFDKLQAEIDEQNQEIANQKQAQQLFADLLAEPFCPTCLQPITQKFIDQKVREHKGFEEEAAEKIQNLLQDQKALGDIAGAEASLQKQQANLDAKLAAKRELTGAEERLKELDAEISRLSKALDSAKANQAAPQDTSALDTVNEQIAVWEARLSPAVTYETTLRQVEQETARQKQQQAKVNDLETLCAHFGKDGVKAKLIAEHVDQFATTVNSVLGAWGYAAALVIEPYEFLVSGQKGQLPLKELSKSEKRMFGVALQTAIAMHAKIRLVVIDEADVFIDSERNRLFNCVNNLLKAGTLDQAIILVSDNNMLATPKEGVAVYHVADGRVVKL